MDEYPYILAVDPGPEQSAAVLLKDQPGMKLPGIEWKAKLPNEEMLPRIRQQSNAILVVEMIACYGMPVGRPVFETCVWIGRFIQAHNGTHSLMYRREVKLWLCDSVRAKDGNVRQALIDLFPKTGGGAIPQIGIKAQRGPLYGFSQDMWAALGVGMTWLGGSRVTSSL